MMHSETTQRLQTLGEHQDLLQRVITTAKERILIASPFISISAIKSDNINSLVMQAVNCGVLVQVFIDSRLNCYNDGIMKEHAKDGIAALVKAGAKVGVVDGIHNKTLARDDDLIAEGSFNWLSAVRTRNGDHQREERTLVYTGDLTAEMIEAELVTIEQIGYGEATLRKTEITENHSRVGTVAIYCFILAIPVLTGHDVADRIVGFVCTVLLLAVFMVLFRIRVWIDANSCEQPNQQGNQMVSDEEDESYAWEMGEQPGQIATNANNAFGTLPGNIIGGPVNVNMLTHQTSFVGVTDAFCGAVGNDHRQQGFQESAPTPAYTISSMSLPLRLTT